MEGGGEWNVRLVTHPLAQHVVVAVLKNLLGRIIALESDEAEAARLVVVGISHDEHLLQRFVAMQSCESQVLCTFRKSAPRRQSTTVSLGALSTAAQCGS
jgi:hypothetical protein